MRSENQKIEAWSTTLRLRVVVYYAESEKTKRIEAWSNTLHECAAPRPRRQAGPCGS
jgi:hypothetical protein